MSEERKTALVIADETFETLPKFYRELKSWWEEIRIDPERVIEQLAEQPALYAFYAAMYSDMKDFVAEEKEALKVLEAQVYAEFSKSRTVGAKKSEAEIKHEMTLDTRIMAKRKKYREMQSKQDKLRVAVTAMQMKHESLRSIGARHRVEIENIHGPEVPPQSKPSVPRVGKNWALEKNK